MDSHEPPRGVGLLLALLPRNMREEVRHDLDDEFQIRMGGRGAEGARGWY